MKCNRIVIRILSTMLIFFFIYSFEFNTYAADSKIQIVKFEKFDDISLISDCMQGFSSVEESETTLLNMYNNIRVNEGEDSVQIKLWSIVNDDANFNNSKAGTYTFEASLLNSEKYDIYNIGIELPVIHIIISDPIVPKTAITKFEEFDDISVNTASTKGFETLDEAIVTLNEEYKSVKVNDSDDTVIIEKWSFDENNEDYDSTKPGAYNFKAILKDSEKYDTQNIEIPLPIIAVIFTEPKGSLKITAATDKNRNIINADITISNGLNTYHGFTDENGEFLISNIICGNYKISMNYNNTTYIKSLIISNGVTSNIDWIVAIEKVTSYITEITTVTTTTTAKSTTIPATSITDATKPLDFKEQIINSNNNPTDITTIETDSGLEVEISIDKMSDEQLSEVREMSVSDVYSEIQKAIDAVSTVNFIKTTDEARKKIADVTQGLSAGILPVSFTLHANFLFPVKVSIYAGKGVLTCGNNYSLYYYNPETKLIEDCGKASVSENGVVSFTISHCSDYFVLDKIISANNDSFKNDIIETKTIDNTTKELNLTTSVIKNQSTQTAITSEYISAADTSADKDTVVVTEKSKSTGKKLIFFGFILIVLCSKILSNRHKK